MVPGEPLGRDVRVTHILATIRPSVKRYFRNIWLVAMRIAFQILFGFLLFSAAIAVKLRMMPHTVPNRPI